MGAGNGCISCNIGITFLGLERKILDFKTFQESRLEIPSQHRLKIQLLKDIKIINDALKNSSCPELPISLLLSANPKVADLTKWLDDWVKETSSDDQFPGLDNLNKIIQSARPLARAHEIADELDTLKEKRSSAPLNMADTIEKMKKINKLAKEFLALFEDIEKAKSFINEWRNTGGKEFIENLLANANWCRDRRTAEDLRSIYALEEVCKSLEPNETYSA